MIGIGSADSSVEFNRYRQRYEFPENGMDTSKKYEQLPKIVNVDGPVVARIFLNTIVSRKPG